MNQRFWICMVVVMAACGIGGRAVVAKDASPPSPAAPGSFLSSFYRVEYLTPPGQSQSWVLVGVAGDAAPVQTSLMRGRWGIVNIWATWCAPCLYELPKLNALAARLSGPNDPYVWAVSVDRDVSRDRLKTYIKRFGLDDVPVLQDASGTVRGALNVDQLPVTFLVAPDGSVDAALYGAAEWDSAAAVEFVRGLK